MKSALVIGGVGALEATIGIAGMPEVAAAEPAGVLERNNRQHAWDAFEATARGTSVPPPHHLLLLFDYDHDGAPSAGHRRQVASALDTLEEAFEWSHEGLLFTLGYAPSYFDRFDEDLPYGVDPDEGGGLLRPERTVEATALDREDPVADGYDAAMHIASDHVQNILAAEAALWGEREEVNGVTFEDTFADVFTKPESYPERRTGFAGHENVSENLADDTDFDTDAIPEDSDLSMGFNPLYENSVPEETVASIVEDQHLVEPKPPGVFAQGTIQHVSKLDVDLDRWYGQDDDQRREQMFSPHHDEEHMAEGNGANVDGGSSAPGETALRDVDDVDGSDIAERTEADAAEHGTVGHAQKTARARFDIEERLTGDAGGNPSVERDDDLPGHDDDQDLETVMLRRDIDTTDQGTPGVHFVGLMRFNGYMTYMRQAMNGIEFDSATFGLDGDARIDHDAVDIDPANSGIVDFLTTQRRGNFLVPPITLRALPHPGGHEATISVAETADGYRVEVGELEGDGGAVDPDTLRFGQYRVVNRGGGAEPTDVSRQGGTLTLEFPAEGTGLAEGGRARLFGKRANSGRPIRGTADL